MKKLIIAVIALTTFSFSTFAQAVKKAETSKLKVVKKTDEVKTPAKVVAINKAAQPAAVTVVKKTAVAKQEVKTASSTKASSSTPLKKDGTPDKRFTAKKVETGTLKKDGTPDMRYKANKKQK